MVPQTKMSEKAPQDPCKLKVTSTLPALVNLLSPPSAGPPTFRERALRVRARRVGRRPEGSSPDRRRPSSSRVGGVKRARDRAGLAAAERPSRASGGRGPGGQASRGRRGPGSARRVQPSGRGVRSRAGGGCG